MTMLDRCARAISGAPFPSKAAYRKARAVLEALRDPTPEMRNAAEQALSNPTVHDAKAPAHDRG